ncbi:MAG: S49 family peptidase, partial [Betaproteobacteria bacterium]|nr:S49 family peptidase [Betaproteobacteria bacterium]
MTDPNPHSLQSTDPARDILVDLAREALDEKRRARRWSIAFRSINSLILL